jgi:hypothetical protein
MATRGLALAGGAQSGPPPPSAAPRRPSAMPRPRPRPQTEAPDEELAAPSPAAPSEPSGGDGATSIRVTSMSNVKPAHRAVVRTKLERALAQCAAATGLTGKIIVLLYADGRIEVQGGSPAFRQCLERGRTLEALRAALPKDVLADAGRPAILEVTLR